MNQSITFYEAVGGEAGVRALVNRFYDYMDELEEAKTIRLLHAKSLRVSREKLFKFLSGWMGGPDLYVQEYGHPRLRARHLPFSIGITERNQWMMCMTKAIADTEMDPDVARKLTESLYKTADFMRNRAEPAELGSPAIFPGIGPLL